VLQIVITVKKLVKERKFSRLDSQDFFPNSHHKVKGPFSHMPTNTWKKLSPTVGKIHMWYTEKIKQDRRGEKRKLKMCTSQ
jgi:hypothetical protein